MQYGEFTPIYNALCEIYCSLAVFLAGAITAFFISDKKGLKYLAES